MEQEILGCGSYLSLYHCFSDRHKISSFGAALQDIEQYVAPFTATVIDIAATAADDDNGKDNNNFVL
ncbi:Hypothetical predicted protein [Octopus vulgaris]|uniref:Uncharacterized protein n=1 Tax=Octopus vulgaris TaxID=6645 RepID=A0AA36AKG9_OCTVU|nr:Hypothetical predicted protein [Octopus vulgaris]